MVALELWKGIKLQPVPPLFTDFRKSNQQGGFTRENPTSQGRKECFTTRAINMKSLTFLIRPRRGQASLGQAQQSHQLQAADKGGNSRKAVDLRSAIDKKQEDGDTQNTSSDSKTPHSSHHISPAELRNSIGNAQDILSQILNTFLAEQTAGELEARFSSEEEQTDHKATSISTSIALHLADLQTSARALHAILGKKHLAWVSEAKEPASEDEPSIERQPRRLPTPELGDSFDGDSVLDCATSSPCCPDLNDANSEQEATPLLPFPLIISRKLPPSPPPPAGSPELLPVTTPSGSATSIVPPLRLPRRSCSVPIGAGGSGFPQLSKAPGLKSHRGLRPAGAPRCSPFEKEMRDIDRHIKESSGSPHSTNNNGSNSKRRCPPSVSLMHRRKATWNDLSIQCTELPPRACRRVASLNLPGAGRRDVRHDSPTVGTFWSIPHYDARAVAQVGDSLPPADERSASGSCDLERQFSTEAKTRRLRSLKRVSAPALMKTSSIDDEGEAEEEEEEEHEPLRMEELMDFLREGNSMRDL